MIEGGLARFPVRKLSEGLVDREIEVHVLTRGGEESPGGGDGRRFKVHRVREYDSALGA